MPPVPARRDCLQRSMITIRLLRIFCQLLEKLWTSLFYNGAMARIKNQSSKPELDHGTKSLNTPQNAHSVCNTQ